MKKELDEFLKEMAKAPLLDRVEERKLLKAVQQKGTDCDEMRKLIECSGRHIISDSNGRFIVSLASQYQNQGLSLMELIDEARKGLVKAAVKYDIKSDFSFISYAVWWMRQSIIQALE